jgi:hypothetical protein
VTRTARSSDFARDVRGQGHSIDETARRLTFGVAGLVIVQSAVTLPNGAGGTTAKIAVTTVETDELKWWNTTNKRWIPQQAGFYMVGGFFVASVGVTTTNFIDLLVTKNGGSVAPFGAFRMEKGSAAGTVGIQGGFSYPLLMNGTTDYIELWGNSTMAATTGTATLWAYPIGG